MKKCYEKNFQWYFLQSGSSFIFPKLNWILSLKALNPFDTKWIRFEWEPNLAGYFCSSLLFKLLNTWPNMQCYYMYNFNTCKNCNIKQNNLNICCIILFYCVYVCCVSLCVYSTHEEFTRPLVEISLLFLPCGSKRLNLGCQTLYQA